MKKFIEDDAAKLHKLFNEPLVMAIMLANGRPEMVKRAVACFRAQTYPNAVLVVWDNGAIRLPVEQQPFDRIWWWTGERKSIGLMRNNAIEWALSGPTPHPQLFATWDSDDWSSPQRLEEQVELWQASDAECVGYNQALFYDMRPGAFSGAWLYRSPDTKYAIGASLCFSVKAWQRVKFPDLPKPGSNNAEDRYFTNRVRTLGVSGIGGDGEPRLICGVHSGNSANYGWAGSNKRLRAPEFDLICQERMRL